MIRDEDFHSRQANLTNRGGRMLNLDLVRKPKKNMS